MVLFRLIFEVLIKLSVAVVCALLLQGSVERERLLLGLGLLVLARGYWLGREWLKPRRGDRRWLALERAHAIEWWRAARPPEAVEAEPGEAEIAATRDEREVRAGFEKMFRRRTDADIASEALSLVTLAPSAFLLALMLTSPVVAWTGFDRGPAAAALLAGVGLHFVAGVIPVAKARARVLARGILMVLILVPCLLVAKARHPYLLARGAEQRRMMAERVWSLGLTIEAGRHAGVLFAYARDLEEERRWEDAVVVYKRGLALDAYTAEGHEGLARAYAAMGGPEVGGQVVEASRPSRRGATAGNELPVFDWTPTGRLRVCLVPVGEVPVALLNAAGRELGEELDAEVYRYGENLSLPEHDRKAGWLGAKQWQPQTVMAVFAEQLRSRFPGGAPPIGAWQFILVTSGDLYTPGANFIFGASAPVHGVVSFARFGDGNASSANPRLVERLAKQLTATAIKSFGVEQAGRPDCVTAYVRSLAELDRKSRAPAEETWAEYRRRVAAWEKDPLRLPKAR